MAVQGVRSKQGERNNVPHLTSQALKPRQVGRDAEATAQTVVLAVLDAMEAFRGPDEPADDTTLMAVRVNG